MKYFNAVWEIYEDSFPEDERRNLEEQRKLLNNPLYNFIPIHDEEKLIGFVAIWNLNEFIFIEHLAIKKELRGNGYGTKIIEDIKSKYNKNIILEVEKPKTYEAKIRIEFYKRLGFYLNEYDYSQPSLGENKEPVPLFLMSFPENMNICEFKEIKEKLYTIVYKQ
jgi:ribosomal protein S18 acetylase RimI-like enzyme